MMSQNIYRQSPIRMFVVVNRLPNVRLRTVNQMLNLLERNVDQPRMRPGQLAQVTRCNPKLSRRGADIRMMLNER